MDMEQRGKPRFRCRNCNEVFEVPQINLGAMPWNMGEVRWTCPGCGKPPRQPKCGPPIDPLNPGSGRRHNEHTCVW